MAWNEVETGGVWEPKEVGDKLEGVLKSRESKKGQNDRPYTIFTIEDGMGESFQVWGAVLEGKLAQVEDGSKVLLTYKGEQRGKNGNKYKDFSVAQWED